VDTPKYLKIIATEDMAQPCWQTVYCEQVPSIVLPQGLPHCEKYGTVPGCASTLTVSLPPLGSLTLLVVSSV